MSVSLLIPALNEGDNLRRTIESARATTTAATEIIVVDDGSSDRCADFLRDRESPALLAQQDQREQRLGAARARNRAASLASGDVLIFLDAHVDLEPGWVDALLAPLSEPGVGATAPAISVRGNEDNVGYGLRWRNSTLAVEWLPPAARTPYAVPLLPGACIAIRRDVFFACGGFDRGLIQWGSEDAELSLRLWLLGYELRVVPGVVVSHLFRERHPYEVESAAVIHNQLRVAFVHFTQQRLLRVIEAMKNYQHFAMALTLLAAGDALGQRAFMRRCARWQDDAYFQRFGDI